MLILNIILFVLLFFDGHGFPAYIAALPDDNIGVNLAELTMSVFCYPMEAAIGCGLQNAETFPLKTQRMSKNSYVFLQRVTQS